MLLNNLSCLSSTLSFAFARQVVAACYYADSSLVTDLDYQPCNSASGPTSMCCATNRTNAPGTGRDVRDSCLPNGLCQNVYVDSQGREHYDYFRDSCSSPDWKGCLMNVCETASVGTPRYISSKIDLLRAILRLGDLRESCT